MFTKEEILDLAKDAILDAIENRKIANQCHDKGLDCALKCIEWMKIRSGQGHDVDKFYKI